MSVELSTADQRKAMGLSWMTNSSGPVVVSNLVLAGYRLHTHCDLPNYFLQGRSLGVAQGLHQQLHEDGTNVLVRGARAALYPRLRRLPYWRATVI